jgi:hypothetical protein
MTYHCPWCRKDTEKVVTINLLIGELTLCPACVHAWRMLFKGGSVTLRSLRGGK